MTSPAQSAIERALAMSAALGDDYDGPAEEDWAAANQLATARPAAPANARTAATVAATAAPGGKPMTAIERALAMSAGVGGPRRAAVPGGYVASAPRRAAPPAPPPKPRENVEGFVESVRMFGDWGKADVWVSKPAQRLVTIVGPAVAQLREGMDYVLIGTWQQNAKYGEQFQLDVAQPQIQPHPAAIAKYIEANFQGVGPKTAQRFVKSVADAGGDAALDELRNRLINEPWAVDLSPVMRKGREASFSGEHKQAALAAYVHRELALRVGAVEGMRDNVLKALSGWLAKQIEHDHQVQLVAARQAAAAAGEPMAPPATLEMKDKAWALLCADPYKAIGEVPGYGFVTADKIGQQVQFAVDDPRRLAALVAFAQQEFSERAGHVFLTREQLTSTIKRLDARVDVDQAVECACKAGTVVVDDKDLEPGDDDQGGEGTVATLRYYHPRMLKAEQRLADKVATLMQPARALVPPPTPNWSSRSSRFPASPTPAVPAVPAGTNAPNRFMATANDQLQARGAQPGAPAAPTAAQLHEQALRERVRQAAKSVFDGGLDESQEQALINILTSRTRLHTLTAGPGCGKTALMEVLVKVLSDKKFDFCAPTGKAAKVMTARLERLGQTCSTTYSMLQGSGPGDFAINADDQLTGDILVVDESSMLDLEIAQALMDAVHDDMHVILLGDTRQLPSISPGMVLQDLLKVAGADHNRLTKPHRNSGGILDVVNEAGAGSVQTVDRESVKFSHGLGEASTEFHGVMAAYLGAVSRVGIERTVLIMPKRQGEVDQPGWNTTYSNAVLRQVLNPNAPKVVGTSFCVNDRVIVRQNMTLPQPTPEELQTGRRMSDDEEDEGGEDKRLQVRVVNGDTGTIKSYVAAPKGSREGLPQWITVDLDDGRRVHLPGAAAADMGLAYALTVHAAQGSEYTEVLMVVTPGTPSFMNRNMIFTGFSRARERLSVFGEDRVIAQVAKTPLPSRNTALSQRVSYELNHEDDDDTDQRSDATNEPPQADEALETSARQRFG